MSDQEKAFAALNDFMRGHRYPEEGCPPTCVSCHRAFVDGETINPGTDGMRCEACFAQEYAAAVRGLTADFAEINAAMTGENSPDRRLEQMLAATAGVTASGSWATTGEAIAAKAIHEDDPALALLAAVMLITAANVDR